MAQFTSVTSPAFHLKLYKEYEKTKYSAKCHPRSSCSLENWGGTTTPAQHFAPGFLFSATSGIIQSLGAPISLSFCTISALPPSLCRVVITEVWERCWVWLVPCEIKQLPETHAVLPCKETTKSTANSRGATSDKHCACVWTRVRANVCEKQREKDGKHVRRGQFSKSLFHTCVNKLKADLDYGQNTARQRFLTTAFPIVYYSAKWQISRNTKQNVPPRSYIWTCKD